MACHAAAPEAAETDAPSTTCLTDLPGDLLGHIYALLDPASRRALFHTCRALHGEPAITHQVNTLCVDLKASAASQGGQLATFPRGCTLRKLVSDAVETATLLDFLGQADGRATLATVTELELWGCRGLDQPIGAAALAAALASACPRLRALLVFGSHHAHLYEALAAGPIRLVELRLRSWEGGGDGAGRALAQLGSLEVLDVGCRGHLQLVGLGGLQSLRKLDLSAGHGSCPDLAHVLAGCTRLQELHLRTLPRDPGAALRSASLQCLGVKQLDVQDLPVPFQLALPGLRRVELQELEASAGLTAEATAAGLREAAARIAATDVVLGRDGNLSIAVPKGTACGLVVEALAPLAELRGSPMVRGTRTLSCFGMGMKAGDMGRLCALFPGLEGVFCGAGVELAPSSVHEALQVPALRSLTVRMQGGAFGFELISACTAAQLCCHRHSTVEVVLRHATGDNVLREQARSVVKAWGVIGGFLQGDQGSRKVTMALY